MQKLSWDYFAIRTVSTIHLCSHITLSSGSNVNIVEWLADLSGLSYFAIRIEFWIFKTQSKSTMVQNI